MNILAKLNPLKKVEEKIQEALDKITELNTDNDQNSGKIETLKAERTKLVVAMEIDEVDNKEAVEKIDERINEINESINTNPAIVEERGRRLKILNEKKDALIFVENTEKIRNLAKTLNKKTKKLVSMLDEADNLNDKISKEQEAFLKISKSLEKLPENLPFHGCSRWALKRLAGTLKIGLESGQLCEYQLSYHEAHTPGL